MSSLNGRLTRLEADALAQAEADFSEMLDWAADWLVANIPARLDTLTVDDWLTADEIAQMLRDMPPDLEARADRAWKIIGPRT